MSALIDTQTRKLCAQLLGAMACRQAGEPSPQRLHFRLPVEPEQPAKCGRVAILEMLGPFDPQQRHEEECQQRRAQAIKGRTDFTVEFATDPKQPALDQALLTKELYALADVDHEHVIIIIVNRPRGSSGGKGISVWHPM